MGSWSRGTSAGGQLARARVPVSPSPATARRQQLRVARARASSVTVLGAAAAHVLEVERVLRSAGRAPPPPGRAAADRWPPTRTTTSPATRPAFAGRAARRTRTSTCAPPSARSASSFAHSTPSHPWTTLPARRRAGPRRRARSATGTASPLGARPGRRGEDADDGAVGVDERAARHVGRDGDAGLDQPGDVDAGTGVDHHVAVGHHVDADAVVEPPRARRPRRPSGRRAAALDEPSVANWRSASETASRARSVSGSAPTTFAGSSWPVGVDDLDLRRAGRGGGPP